MQYYTLQQASAELNKIISRAVFEVSVHSPLPFAGSAAILTAISAGVTPALPRGSEHLRQVQVWIDLHEEELMADWTLAVNGEPVFPIDPLR